MQRNSFRWYHAMPFVLCMIIMFFPYTAHSNHIWHGGFKLGLCRDKMPQVVEQFVQREFPEQLQSYSYKPPWGILCHESGPLADLTGAFEKKIRRLYENNSPPEKIREELRQYAELFQSITTEHADMFDVLIVVVTTEKFYYQIFHIHFDFTGTFKETYDTANTEWVSSVRGTKWNSEWCEFVFDIYPERLEMFERRGICKKEFVPPKMPRTK